MKFEIDEKIIAREMADKIYDYAYDKLSRDEFSTWLYNSEVAHALESNIEKLVAKNEDKIINAIIKLTAEKIRKNISMQAIFSLLLDKKE